MPDSFGLNPVDVASRSLGVTQSELARRLGYSRARVSGWKRRGYIPVSEVKKVSEVSGVPCHLLDAEHFPKPVEVATFASK